MEILPTEILYLIGAILIIVLVRLAVIGLTSDKDTPYADIIKALCVIQLGIGWLIELVLIDELIKWITR